jgi:hypothetical protein
MTERLSDTDASRLAALAGVALGDDAARNAASATAKPLAAADSQSRALAFEAEPSQFLAVQRLCKP